MTSLNPVYSVGNQIAETARLHEVYQHELREIVRWKCFTPSVFRRRKNRSMNFPISFRGECASAMIAMALTCKPRVLIADEPTTALDVTVQAQIFDLLQDLQEQTGTAIILITHDMGAIAEMAQRAMVMYAGRKD